MPLRRSALANIAHARVGSQLGGLLPHFARQIQEQAQRWARATRHRWLALLCSLPVGARLALGFLLAGLVALLASGVTGLLSLQTISQEGSFQSESIAASAELTTALAVLQAYSTRFHMTLEDAVHHQPYSILLDDQATTQNLAIQYESDLEMFLHRHLLAQHPEQVQWLSAPGRSEAVVQQRALVASAISAWQRYHTAQMPVLQDTLAGDVSAAETLTYTQVDALEADMFSALYGLIQFENRLALSEQGVALSQQIQEQRTITILAAPTALLVIFFFGLLSIRSVTGPLNRLRRVMQAVASGKVDVRIDVVGRDSIAAISSGVNDLLMMIDRLLAEISHQHYALVDIEERLFSLVDGDDSSILRERLAEVGDPVTILDSFCRDLIAPMFHRMPELHNLAQQLDSLSQQILLQAEENAMLANKAPTAAIGEHIRKRVQRLIYVAQEMTTIARRLEATTGEVMDASPKAWGSDASEMPVF